MRRNEKRDQLIAYHIEPLVEPLAPSPPLYQETHSHFTRPTLTTYHNKWSRRKRKKRTRFIPSLIPQIVIADNELKNRGEIGVVDIGGIVGVGELAGLGVVREIEFERAIRLVVWPPPAQFLGVGIG